MVVKQQVKAFRAYPLPFPGSSLTQNITLALNYLDSFRNFTPRVNVVVNKYFSRIFMRRNERLQLSPRSLWNKEWPRQSKAKERFTAVSVCHQPVLPLQNFTMQMNAIA